MSTEENESRDRHFVEQLEACLANVVDKTGQRVAEPLDDDHNGDLRAALWENIRYLCEVADATGEDVRRLVAEFIDGVDLRQWPVAVAQKFSHSHGYLWDVSDALSIHSDRLIEATITEMLSG